tara:strand:+ start:506 stop:1585 length:1080 start_codon:yes stop_codon:yes gene_type:complete
MRNIANEKLKKKIKNIIVNQGPIDLSMFMEICLHDNDFGYYSLNNQVIGEKGDFTTAPEISQVFGELIALNLFDNFKNSKINKINLVELGPGKGTLMNDILSTFDKIKNNNISINSLLFEKSSHLKGLQEKNLLHHKCKWIKNINEIPNLPTYFIANEFFDALPINQVISKGGLWYERKIDLKDDNLFFSSGKMLSNQPKENPYPDGKVLEESPETKKIIKIILEIIMKNEGSLLIIDYGQTNEKILNSNSIQSIKDHKVSSIFENLGTTDISSWVNFSDIINSLPKNINIQGPITQREYLINLGIKERFEKLGKNKSSIIRRSLFADFERLVSNSYMGQAFKVMVLSSKKLSQFTGFN